MAERGQFREEIAVRGVAPHLRQARFGYRRHQCRDADAAVEGAVERADDRQNFERLVLDVNRAAGRADGLEILLEDRTLAAGDEEGGAVRGGMVVTVKSGVDRALDLHPALAPGRGGARREDEIGGTVVTPDTVVGRAFAGLVPALHEVVVDVGRRRSGEFQIEVVVRAVDHMRGRDEVSRIEVHAADEGGLGVMPGVKQPALRMLRIAAEGAVPAGAEARVPRGEHRALFGRAGKHGRSVVRRFGIDAPEQHADVEAARDGAVEKVEQRAIPVRHPEVGREEGDGQPDAVPRRLGRRANAPESLAAADQRAQPVARAHRIGGVRRGGDVRRRRPIHPPIISVNGQDQTVRDPDGPGSN